MFDQQLDHVLGKFISSENRRECSHAGTGVRGQVRRPLNSPDYFYNCSCDAGNGVGGGASRGGRMWPRLSPCLLISLMTMFTVQLFQFTVNRSLDKSLPWGALFHSSVVRLRASDVAENKQRGGPWQLW